MTTTTDHPLIFKGAIAPPEPGIHAGVPADEYHKWNAVSSTVLKKLAGKEGCPQKCKHYLDNKDEEETDTPALQLGRAIHDAILLPEDWQSKWAKGNPCEAVLGGNSKRKGELCGKPGKFQEQTDVGLAWVCGTHAGKDPIIPKNMLTCRDVETANNVRDAVHAHPDAEDILFGKGSNEASILWIDKETGLPMKTRIDRYSFTHKAIPQPGGNLVRQRVPTNTDIKTTASACKWKFGKQIHDLGYHIQAAINFEGCDQFGAVDHRRYVYIAVEKTPPYAMGFYDLGDDAIEQGAKEYRRLLNRFAHCFKNDDWPGYTADAIVYISIPTYAFDPE